MEGTERLFKSAIRGVFTVIDTTGFLLIFIVPLDVALVLTDGRFTSGAPQMGEFLLFSPFAGELSLYLNSSKIDL